MKKKYLIKLKKKLNRESVMPKGKGTYGSKRGRPPKKGKKKTTRKKK